VVPLWIFLWCPVKGEIGAWSDGVGRDIASTCLRLFLFVPLDLAGLYVERLLPNKKKIKERARCVGIALFEVGEQLDL